MKITDKDRQKIIALFGSQMSVSDITREINKGRDKELQVSRQAVSKILNQFISGEEVRLSTAGESLDYLDYSLSQDKKTKQRHENIK
ncbi:MAG: hypothetical protein J6Q52_02870 [Clostridia bacterium]|nr:hypothetical protein [Clostridia bacterium]